MTADRAAALDRFFATLYRLRPVDATFIGMHDLDHRMPDWSPAGHEATTGSWEGARSALRGSLDGADEDSATVSGDWARIDTSLALSHCDLAIAELSGSHVSRGNPSLAIGEAAFGVIGLVTRDFRPAAQRASWLLQRLRAVPGFLAGALATLRGQPVAGAWRERALREAAATERLLLEGLPIWCGAMALPGDASQAVCEAGELAAGGVHGFAAALGDLQPAVLDAPPCGEEMLALCIRRGHWIDRPLGDLRAEARARLAEERARLDERVREVGARDLGDVQARLAERHPSPEGYYQSFGDVWTACRAIAGQHRLVTWPDVPIRYVPIPEWTRMAAPSLYYLYYRSPAPLDPPGIHEYVVSPIEGLDDAGRERLLRAWNDSVIKLNHVVHHGALGHHVQNWHAARAPSRIGRVAATDCANRIAMLQGGTMAEGWACYATDLMDEVGFLTPDESVAEQHTRVRLLARAVVDLEFHAGRLGFQDAVRLYVEEVGMAPDAARAETVKNSMFPGTAAMYWLGTQGIHDLRRAMARRLGTAFDLRAFHDTFLSHGSIPVALIHRLMTQGATHAAGVP